MFNSTGNNFGAGQISFKDYQAAKGALKVAFPGGASVPEGQVPLLSFIRLRRVRVFALRIVGAAVDLTIFP